MKKLYIIILLVSLTWGASAQNDSEKKVSPFGAGADFYSAYVWRGSLYSGPAVQPFVEATFGGFTLGAWGSQGFDGFQEMDLYAAYSFEFGLSIGITDYYYTGTKYFTYSGNTAAHAFELNIGYEIKSFSIAANYIPNQGAGSAGNDLYFELGYTFSHFSVFAGAGDGWHTPDGNFNVCNLGISASKEISVTEKFQLPLSGSIILNPRTEQFFIVVGMSL